MDENLKKKAEEILLGGISKTVNNYTENALLINSCSVSANRYDQLTETTGLSTIKNIPPHLRLNQEIDRQYSNEALATEYRTGVIQVVLRNYVVFSISVVDAILEDFYEAALSALEPGLSDQALSKRVGSAWANDKITKYFLSAETLNLRKPNGMNTPLAEAFMRYKELRIIRHSLVHSDGLISEKSLETLEEFKVETPDERKASSIIDSPLINDSNEVTLTINGILQIRKILHNFLCYLLASVQES